MCCKVELACGANAEFAVVYFSGVIYKPIGIVLARRAVGQSGNQEPLLGVARSMIAVTSTPRGSVP